MVAEGCSVKTPPVPLKGRLRWCILFLNAQFFKSEIV